MELSRPLLSAYPGLKNLFNGAGDFSRMARTSSGLGVSQIQHKSVMSVDESGVEATGATGVAITLYAFFPADTEVVLDRPFLAFIVNNKKKTVLFASKVEDPTK